jgi:hypothetical protein
MGHSKRRESTRQQNRTLKPSGLTLCDKSILVGAAYDDGSDSGHDQNQESCH